MNQSKIAKLCNEIEDIAIEIRERTMSDSCFMAQNIIDKSRQITAEISAPPKTNADRIRQMTDEELVEMVSMKVCRIVKPDGKGCQKGFYFGKCDKCVLAWLRKETEKDAGTD